MPDLLNLAGRGMLYERKSNPRGSLGNMDDFQLTHKAARVMQKHYIDEIGNANPLLNNRPIYEHSSDLYHLPESRYAAQVGNAHWPMSDISRSNPAPYLEDRPNAELLNTEDKYITNIYKMDMLHRDQYQNDLVELSVPTHGLMEQERRFPFARVAKPYPKLRYHDPDILDTTAVYSAALPLGQF